MYFNPRLPCGRRQIQGLRNKATYTAFQSTPSVWKATANICMQKHGFTISIHAFRVEGDYAAGDYNDMAHISIHAFRAEGD